MLTDSRRRNSIEPAAPRPSTAPSTLQRRDSNGSLRSNYTTISNRPGQYSAVRQTGSRRLYGNATTTVGNTSAALAARQSSASLARKAGPPTQPSQTTQMRETMRSKPPQVSNTQRRQQNMSSSASIRSFQSDLERINEDYNKTYSYAGQTSASAMRAAAPASARGRRAESVVSSAMSDTSEMAPPDSAQRRKASRVSFSDVDEGEIRSRNPSPNPEKKRSAMKHAASPGAKPNGTQSVGTTLLMPPPTALQRRASNSSIRSNTSIGLGNTPVLAPPIQKQTQQVPGAGKVDDGDLSTIASNSAYSDADEDFKASPALKRQGVDVGGSDGPPLLLTQQNLAAVSGEGDNTTARSPMKSAMKKTPSQSGSARFSQQLETDTQLDVADDESDDSFAARRRAKKIPSKKSFTTLRRSTTPAEAPRRTSNVNGSTGGMQRSNSISSQTSRTSQGPSRMVSLRQNPPQPHRQSLQGSIRRVSSDNIASPVMQRRASLQSSSGLQPPLPPKSVRRASVAGSVAESVRSDAVNQHVAVMELAQQRVQKLLHPDAGDSTATVAAFADANERKRSSFERKRPTTLSRQNSSSSMVDRSFRTSLRPEPAAGPAPTTVHQHRRAASDDRAFATTMRGERAPKAAQRSSSLYLDNSSAAAYDTQSMPATPRKAGRRMSFMFGDRKRDQEAAPPMPALRRYSSDSDTGRPVGRKDAPTNALSAGTLRSSSGRITSAAARPEPTRYESENMGGSSKAGKPKKFQALRKFFKLKS